MEYCTLSKGGTIMYKKLISVFLATSMVFSGIAGYAVGVKNEVQKVYAGEVQTGTCGTNGNLTWTIEDGVLTIEGEGSIGNCDFYERTDIEKVVIKEGVTGIGWYAFEDCFNLKEISFSDSAGSTIKTVPTG